jgi:sugar transferase (PEP-CTERM/EpsH1 system associated)
MNILFLCHRIPYPPDKGEKIRAFHMLAHLARKHVVHLATFVDDPADMAHTETLRRMVGGECLFIPLSRTTAATRMALAFAAGRPLTTSYFASARLTRWIGRLLKRHAIDRIVLFSSAMAPFVLERRDFDPARAVLDMVDVDSDKWSQYARSARRPRSWIYGREARTLFALERKAAAAFGATLFVSPFEAKTFADMAPETRARVHSVPNGVDLDRFMPDASFPNPFGEGELPIVMVGTMDYRPNVEGATWFAEKVLPLIRAKLPGAKFFIVGAKPTAELLTPREGVAVTGRVDDVRPYVAHACVVVAPLRLARGVQNKVLEGLAMRKPVVATLAASRGLGVVAGVDLWVEDEPQRFAEAVIAAATGPDRDRIAENGRRRVERDYDWAANLSTLDRLLEYEPRGDARGTAAGWSRRQVLGEGAE